MPPSVNSSVAADVIRDAVSEQLESVSSAQLHIFVARTGFCQSQHEEVDVATNLQVHELKWGVNITKCDHDVVECDPLALEVI